MNEIKKMVEDGFSIKRIAENLKLSESQIKEIIINNNFKLIKETFNEELIEHIVDLYKMGVSAKQLGIKYSIDKRRIQKWVDDKGILRTKNESHRIIKFNENIFDNIDNFSKAYWLGFFYADAYNSDITNTVSVSLQANDLNHIQNLADFMGLPKNKISYTKTNEGYEHNTLKMYSKHLCEKLTSLGCPRAKSFIIKFPDWLNDNLHSHFIRGMFDGDGSKTCNKSTNEWKLSLVSTLECCETIQYIILDKLDFIINFHNISKTGHNTCEIETHGNKQINKLLDWLYKDSDENIRLYRKYNRYKTLIEQQNNKDPGQIRIKISNEEKENIIIDINNGISINDISKKYNRHPRTINKLKGEIK